MSKALWSLTGLSLLAIANGHSQGQEPLSVPPKIVVGSDTPVQPPPAPPPSPKMLDGWEALNIKLDLNQPFEANLIEVLWTIQDLAESKKKDVVFQPRILVDEKAMGLAKNEIYDANRVTIKLPKLPGVEFETAMDLIVWQMDAVYRIRNGIITIEPKPKKPAGDTADLNRLIKLNTKLLAKSTYLAHLQEIRKRHGINIVIDPDTEKKLESETANLELQNVTALNAVRLIASMSGTELVVVDNILYLTDAKRAAAMHAQTQVVLRLKESPTSEVLSSSITNSYSIKPADADNSTAVNPVQDKKRKEKSK